MHLFNAAQTRGGRAKTGPWMLVAFKVLHLDRVVNLLQSSRKSSVRVFP